MTDDNQIELGDDRTVTKQEVKTAVLNRLEDWKKVEKVRAVTKADNIHVEVVLQVANSVNIHRQPDIVQYVRYSEVTEQLTAHVNATAEELHLGGDV